MFVRTGRIGLFALVVSILTACNQKQVAGQDFEQVNGVDESPSPVSITVEPESRPTSTLENFVDWETVTFALMEGYIPNPSMGWQDTESTNIRFPETVGYRRFNWSDLNPAPGIYNWGPIEDLRNELIPRDRQISWRIRTARPAPFGPGQVMPDWVVARGAEIFFTYDNGSEPRYSDCIFLETHGQFVDAMREKYDGDPDVGFIDVGSYGYFGEWDSDQYDEDPQSLDWHARRRIVDMYLGGSGERPCLQSDGSAMQVGYTYVGFQHTQLIMGYTPWFEDSLRYALERRDDVGIRQDSLGSETHQEYIRDRAYDLFQSTWQQAPIVFEFAPEAYTSEALKRAGEFAREMHITFVHDNIEGRGEDEEILGILEVIGYRLTLTQAGFQKQINLGAELPIDLHWINSGVAPPYIKLPLVAVLTDFDGNMVHSQDLRSDITTWLPGDPFVVSRKIVIPSDFTPGIYHLKIAILDPRDAKPAITLANEGQDEQGYYLLGLIEILP